jgi:SAM-dependent methyltransferase
MFDARAPLPEWPVKRLLTGVGVSDWPDFAGFFVEKFDYVNTQFDHAIRRDRPFLDVTKPDPGFLGSADVVLCSEVLEHVEPPVQRAFDGLFSLLKKDGVLILTVPIYIIGRTVEHFPSLFRWQIVERGGHEVLHNVTRDGRVQEFKGLAYHGGGERVLEMRVFGLNDLRKNLETAGFRDVQVMDYDVPEFGIRQSGLARPVIARRL